MPHGSYGPGIVDSFAGYINSVPYGIVWGRISIKTEAVVVFSVCDFKSIWRCCMGKRKLINVDVPFPKSYFLIDICHDLAISANGIICSNILQCHFTTK